MKNVRLPYAIFLSLMCALTAVSRAVAQQGHPQKSAQAKKATSKPPDFSALAPLNDALLELKGAVNVGVIYQDYLRKVQTAAGEELKAEDRIRGDVPYPVTHRLLCYKITLLSYKSAVTAWETPDLHARSKVRRQPWHRRPNLGGGGAAPAKLARCERTVGRVFPGRGSQALI